MAVNHSVLPGETKKNYTARVARETQLEIQDRRGQMESGKIPVCMEVDDFGFLLPGYDDLMRLKRSIPDIKLTLFTIPMDSKFFNSANAKHFKWESYKKWAKIINNLDWVEIALHGFAHVHNECDTTYEQSNLLLDAAEKLFDRVGLEYVKIIRAPYWQMSYDFMVACRDRGYTVAIDKDHVRPVPEGLKTYIFNWSFEQPLPMDVPVIKGHGHFTGNNMNNIHDTLDNILKQIPAQSKGMFLSEYLRVYGSDTDKIVKLYSKE